MTVKTFAQLTFNHFSLSLKRKKSKRNHEKEKDTVKLQQPIYQILRLEMWVGANAGIAKKKQEKYIVFVVERWMIYQMKNLMVLQNVLSLLEL